MREILFRGIANGEGNAFASKKENKWIFGQYVHRTKLYGDEDDTHFIIEGGEFDADYYDCFVVYPDTVCQYTGLQDKNGVLIFENDIVVYEERGIYEDIVVYGIVKFGLSSDDIQVEDAQRLFGFYIEWIGNSNKYGIPWSDIWRPDIAYWVRKEMVTVYGNIFDNDIKELGE
jgi:uncharacterized phage protein (TIGR01671 family)